MDGRCLSPDRRFSEPPRPGLPLPAASEAAGIGACAASLALMGLFAGGLEGLGCSVMAMPLILPAGALGGWLAHILSRPRDAAFFLLLPPAAFAYDTAAQPPLYEVRTAIEIAAAPELVWRSVVAFPDLPPPREWYFHTGLAYPLRARIDGSGPGAVRYCEFSTGSFVEPIETWDEPRLLRFRVTANPAPMREWSPYGEIQPNHLHGYLVSEQGQFRLTPLAGGRTLLEGTTWYRHGLWPAQYWRWWSDAIIHRIHLRVLNHIRTLAELAPRANDTAPNAPTTVIFKRDRATRLLSRNGQRIGRVVSDLPDSVFICRLPEESAPSREVSRTPPELRDPLRPP
jgi:hypothetical protein